MNDSGKAARLANELLARFAGDQPILPGRTEIFVADIASHLERFGQFMKWGWKFQDFPCLIDEEGPLPIEVPTTPAILTFTNVTAATPLFAFIESFQSQGLRFESVPRDEVRRIIQTRLTAFLSVRFSSHEEGPELKAMSVGAAHAGFASGPSGYLSFQVQTRQRGLRIHYSPSYLLDWSNVFGAPTTPVDGWIRPGRYKFGAMKPDGSFAIDNGNFDIPPHTAARLSF